LKRKDNNQNLGEAIRQMIVDLGIEERIFSVQAEEMFQEMMGSYIMGYVEKFEVKNRILYIKIKSPELKNELLYGKDKIKAHINEGIGKDYLTEIKFL
jgi:hypothetical protein